MPEERSIMIVSFGESLFLSRSEDVAELLDMFEALRFSEVKLLLGGSACFDCSYDIGGGQLGWSLPETEIKCEIQYY